MRKIVKNTSVVALVLCVASCQNFDEDVLPVAEVESRTIQVVAQQPQVVDVLEGVATEEPINLQIVSPPSNGEFTMKGRSLGLYSTNARAGSRDEFTIAMETSSGRVTKTFSMESVTRSNYPISEQGAVYDRGGILKKGETIVSDVLANDAPGAASLEIVISPTRGRAEVTDDSQIIYTAASDFEGLDDLIYTVQFPNGNTGTALVRFAIE
ncbi:MAG: Ig-like domain-containing protein [Bacteroidota bacterium]